MANFITLLVRVIEKTSFRSDFYEKFYVKMEINFEANVVMLTL